MARADRDVGERIGGIRLWRQQWRQWRRRQWQHGWMCRRAWLDLLSVHGLRPLPEPAALRHTNGAGVGRGGCGSPRVQRRLLYGIKPVGRRMVHSLLGTLSRSRWDACWRAAAALGAACYSQCIPARGNRATRRQERIP